MTSNEIIPLVKSCGEMFDTLCEITFQDHKLFNGIEEQLATFRMSRLEIETDPDNIKYTIEKVSGLNLEITKAIAQLLQFLDATLKSVHDAILLHYDDEMSDQTSCLIYYM
jgi:hypothetical protein